MFKHTTDIRQMEIVVGSELKLSKKLNTIFSSTLYRIENSQADDGKKKNPPRFYKYISKSLHIFQRLNVNYCNCHTTSCTKGRMSLILTLILSRYFCNVCYQGITMTPLRILYIAPHTYELGTRGYL